MQTLPDVRTHDLKQGATLFTPETPSGLGVLLTHGWLSNRRGYEGWAERLTQELGATTMPVDLLGHGDSEGDEATLSVNGYVESLAGASDVLAQQPDVDRLAVVGKSFGGYLAVLLGEIRPNIRGMLLQAPALYPDNLRDVPRDRYQDVQGTSKVWELDPEPDNPALSAVTRRAQHFGRSMFLVTLGLDRCVSAASTQAYKTAVETGGGRHEAIASQHVLDDMARQAFLGYMLNWAAEL